MMENATWRKMIVMEMKDRGETFGDTVSCTLSEAELDEVFDDGYGGSEGKHFTLWTANRVYFPVVYDGAEWVGSVPRNPNDEKSEHVGGQ